MIKYNAAELEVITFAAEDVITTSGNVVNPTTPPATEPKPTEPAATEAPVCQHEVTLNDNGTCPLCGAWVIIR